VEVADTVRERGWTQGSSLYVAPSDRPTLNLDPDQELYLIASHPCDVVNKDFHKEPLVELIPLSTPTSIDGNFTYGKNPRHLHYESSLGIYSADAAKRRSISREYLANLDPISQMEEGMRTLFASWLASRFSRPAFADAFNDRTREASKAISALVKRNGSKISGVYVGVSNKELPDTDPYDTLLLICMRDADFKNATSWGVVNDLAEQVERVMQRTEGINLIDCDVKSEADTSLEELRYLRRWDYDYLSFKEDFDSETLSVKP